MPPFPPVLPPCRPLSPGQQQLGTKKKAALGTCLVCATHLIKLSLSTPSSLPNLGVAVDALWAWEQQAPS